jgi:hypothetical protein
MVHLFTHPRRISLNNNWFAYEAGVDFNVCHNEVQLKKIQPSNQKGDESSNMKSQRLIYYNPFYGISAIPGEHFRLCLSWDTIDLVETKCVQSLISTWKKGKIAGNPIISAA